MKLLFTLFFIIGLCGLYSCNDDDEDNKENTVKIIGTWQETHRTYRITYPNHPERNESEESDLTDDDAPTRLRINADGSMSEGFWENGSYVFNEGEIYGYWQLNGKQLDISESKDFKNEIIHYNIIELTNERMILEESETFKDESGDKYEYYEKAIFKKIN